MYEALLLSHDAGSESLTAAGLQQNIKQTYTPQVLLAR